jgi:ADP-dependent NAD(P)H-hydrate dehydratase
MQNETYPLPLDVMEIAKALLHRPRDSHKYDFGRVAVVGGSRSMAGAPALAAMAALRSGAGVVEVCVPESIQATVAGFDPCLIVHGFPEDETGSFAPSAFPAVSRAIQTADVVAIGPGLGRAPDLAGWLVSLWKAFPRTMVWDADALAALASLDRSAWGMPGGARLMTPHAGEMRRLLAEQVSGREAMERAASHFAGQHGAVVVLKGPDTLITDGISTWHNTSGNPGMATAGTGDVLSGVLAALCAQGVPVLQAAKLGVWLHGVAGDYAAAQHSQPAMTATDVLNALAQAWKRLAQP